MQQDTLVQLDQVIEDQIQYFQLSHQLVVVGEEQRLLLPRLVIAVVLAAAQLMLLLAVQEILHQ